MRSAPPRVASSDRPGQGGWSGRTPSGTICATATPRRTRIEGRGTHSVSTIELFFDLVFVFALTQVTDLMASDTQPTTLLRGALILTVMWWCWVGYSWLGNVTRPDEGLIRVGVYSAMAAVFVAAIAIPESFDDLPGGLSGPVVFAVCYVVVRIVHVGLFLAFSREDPVLRRQLVRWLPSIGLGTALLLIASQTTGSRRRCCGWPRSSGTTWARPWPGRDGSSRRRRTSPSGTG